MEWEELQGRVDSFASEINGFAAALGFSVDKTKQLWNEARDIQAGFNSNPRFPTREEQQKCWEHFQEARTELANIGRRERECKESVSKIHRDRILDLIKEAQIHNSPLPLPPFGVSTEYLKQAGQKLRSAGIMLSEHKYEMLSEHKGECFEAIVETQKNHDIWWAHIKEGFATARDSRKQRIKANLAKNRAAYQKCSTALARQRARESDLESKITRLHNPDWIEDNEEWLRECRELINSMENTLARYEAWIHEDEEQLNR